MDNKIINLSLDELCETEGLCTRIKNFCIHNDLLDVNSIIKYSEENGNFLNAKKCGRKTNLELMEIYLKYKRKEFFFETDYIEESQTNRILGNFDSKNNDKENVTESNLYPKFDISGKDILNLNLEELSLIEDISIRTINICESAGLIDIKSIMNFHMNGGDISNYKNCGLKSSLEFSHLCKKYENLATNNNIEFNNKNQIYPLSNVIESLSINHKLVINSFIETKFNNLSEISSKVLSSKFKPDYSLIDFNIDLLIKDYEQKKIQRVGYSKIREIEDFINEIKEYTELVCNLKTSQEISFESFNAYLTKKFSLNREEITKNYDMSKGVPIFRTIYALIENEKIFTKREKEIFKLGFNYYTGFKATTLNVIAEKNGLTIERTRQLRVKLFNNLGNTFAFLKEFELDIFNLYGLDLTSHYLVVDENCVSEINKIENTNFNQFFVNKILSILLYDKYTLIGNEYDIITERTYRTSDHWNNIYLISNKYTDKINLAKFIYDVKYRLSVKIEETYCFHFQTYLLEFQIENCRNEIENIAQIAEYILFQECELIIDAEENIVFNRNIVIPAIEYVYEVLEDRNKPLTVYEMFEIIGNKYPNEIKTTESLRSYCLKDSKLIFFGRSSTYGLKIWEDRSDIKGGTIRDIAEEYLNFYSEPKHIDEITEYVNHFRATTSKSIYYNLRMSDCKRFVFFKGMLIGNVNKKYNTIKHIEIDLTLRDLKTREENLTSLLKFTQEYKRLPFSNGNESEVKLYRFMQKQVNKKINNQNDSDYNFQINEILTKFNYEKGKRHSPLKTSDKYILLFDFISSNARVPKANNKEEKILYDFLYRQRKLYQEDKLPKEYIEKFIEIAKLLN